MEHACGLVTGLAYSTHCVREVGSSCVSASQTFSSLWGDMQVPVYSLVWRASQAGVCVHLPACC